MLLLIQAATAILENRLTPSRTTACFKVVTLAGTPKKAELANRKTLAASPGSWRKILSISPIDTSFSLSSALSLMPALGMLGNAETFSRILSGISLLFCMLGPEGVIAAFFCQQLTDNFVARPIDFAGFIIAYFFEISI
jgi:hypothetical protein